MFCIVYFQHFCTTYTTPTTMKRNHSLLPFSLVIALAALNAQVSLSHLSVDAASITTACPCKSEFLCKSIQTQRPEVFGFTGQFWKSYNWSYVTTVAWNDDPDLMCTAHEHGARVVLQAQFDPVILTNETARALWVANHTQYALDHFMDGTNFDFESAVALDSPVRHGYADLIKKTAESFHAAIPGSQVHKNKAKTKFKKIQKKITLTTQLAPLNCRLQWHCYTSSVI
eukprot:m.104980 g.104980  ORF g.104980 m.104980 type:complete len:228 (-) comp13269_c0_seq1:1002-1685(-)